MSLLSLPDIGNAALVHLQNHPVGFQRSNFKKDFPFLDSSPEPLAQIAAEYDPLERGHDARALKLALH